ncbi:hypothetical protein [Pseudomonas deceptionensis]|uniref:Uncharacterized protein n=1 Tax=Pseudomonas deceptionensis TaxID=882211 RepID=A0A1H5N886_PSEDM|nr:hypothetical protein [Pseudomonas deceptionensis]SEE97775.1 hypothetical protein SAMN04489800_3276 [Pseudomonas deceptionensis]
MSTFSERFKYIEVKNIGGQFHVSWNYQGAPGGLSRLAQCERLEGYIDGFIDGFLEALEIPNGQIHRSLSSKCTITDLEEHVALKLKKLLIGLFEPFIAHEHKAQHVNSEKHSIRQNYCAA